MGFYLCGTVTRNKSLAVGVNMRERHTHSGIAVACHNPYTNLLLP